MLPASLGFGAEGVRADQPHLNPGQHVGDRIVVEIVELPVRPARRDVEHPLDPERFQRSGAGHAGDVAVVELRRVVGIGGEPPAIEGDERGRAGGGATLGEEGLVVRRRGEGLVRRDDAARVGPVVEGEDGIEDGRGAGREGDGLGPRQVDDDHDGRVLALEQRGERLAAAIGQVHRRRGDGLEDLRERDRGRRLLDRALTRLGADGLEERGHVPGRVLAARGAEVVHHPPEGVAVEGLLRPAVEGQRLAGRAEAPPEALLRLQRGARLRPVVARSARSARRVRRRARDGEHHAEPRHDPAGDEHALHRLPARHHVRRRLQAALPPAGADDARLVEGLFTLEGRVGVAHGAIREYRKTGAGASGLARPRLSPRSGWTT